MDDQSLLFLSFEPFGEQRPRRRSIRALNRNRQEPSGLVEHDHSIVFVENGELAGETRTPVFSAAVASAPASSTPVFSMPVLSMPVLSMPVLSTPVFAG